MNELVKNHVDIGQNLPPDIEEEIEIMLKSGIHIGHSRSKTSPSMLPYVFGVRNGVAIIDLIKTQEMLKTAMDFVRQIAARKGLVLFVGTRPAVKNIVAEAAEKLKMPYLTERWIGGAMTNFKIINKRVEYMENLEREKATGGFEKYTKKERLKKDEEIRKLQRMFNGLRVMKKMPEAVFIVNVVEDEIAAKEAKIMKVPVVALVDTNSKFSMANVPIPSNDDALPAVNFMVSKISSAIEEGQKSMVGEVKAQEVA